MALQSSGAISLNEIHVEAGGTTGTAASLNDTDIRGLISKGSGAAMSFSEWYGASAVTEVNVVQTGGPNAWWTAATSIKGNSSPEMDSWGSTAAAPRYGSSQDNAVLTNPLNTTEIQNIINFPSSPGSVSQNNKHSVTLFGDGKASGSFYMNYSSAINWTNASWNSDFISLKIEWGKNSSYSGTNSGSLTIPKSALSLTVNVYGSYEGHFNWEWTSTSSTIAAFVNTGYTSPHTNQYIRLTWKYND